MATRMDACDQEDKNVARQGVTPLPSERAITGGRMNEAHAWLRAWVQAGDWSLDSTGDGVVHLRLSLSRSRVSDGFRDDMRRLLEAAKIGLKLIELNKSDVSSIEYENRLGEILEMANEQNVSTTEGTAS